MGSVWLFLFSALLAFATIYVLGRVPFPSDEFNVCVLTIASAVVVLLVAAVRR
jgi:hypothetical protein